VVLIVQFVGIVLFVYFFRDDNVSIYGKTKQIYIRDCYYRIITEILHLDVLTLRKRDEDDCEYNIDVWPLLVVVGNPGIGKSMLSFLFIRALLELGVEVGYLSLLTFFLFLFFVCVYLFRRLLTKI
jgi:hypothetical protein